MAVHLERPLPREPFPGTRHLRRVLALGALLAFGGFAFLAPAHAQDGSLSAGTSAFTACKYDATVRMMTGVLQGDKVDPSEAAKALYYRGLAYQKLKQHTRAIADLGANSMQMQDGIRALRVKLARKDDTLLEAMQLVLNELNGVNNRPEAYR